MQKERNVQNVLSLLSIFNSHFYALELAKNSVKLLSFIPTFQNNMKKVFQIRLNAVSNM